MDMRVFWSVFGALVAFAALVLVLLGLGQRAAEQRQAEVMQSINDYAQQALEEGRRQNAIDARQRAEAKQRALDARRLAPNERCVGGTVIRVEGSSYTQVVGGDLRPVACSGQYRR